MKKLSSILKIFSRSDSETPIPKDRNVQMEAEAAKSQGNQFVSSGDYLSAVQCYQQALKILPSYAEAKINLGSALLQMGRLQEAKELLQSAVILKPSLWQGHYQLGLVLNQLGQFQLAADSLCRSVELHPDFPDCHWQLGLSLAKQGKWSDAVKAFGTASLPDDQFQEMHANYGFALMRTQQFQDSLHHLNIAIKLGETSDLHLVAGAIYEQLSMKPEAELSFQNAVRLDPDNPEINIERAYDVLLQGDYLKGFSQYEKRLKLRVHYEWTIPIKYAIENFGTDRYWQGQDLTGSSMLILREQGLGDSIMMLRYIPLLKKLKGAAKLSVECDPAMQRIYESVPEIDEVVVKRDDIRIAAFDWYCLDMSLPYLFQTELNNIPSAPYLSIPEQHRSKWSERINALEGCKVGIVWSGNSRYGVDSIRSIALEKLIPLFSIAGIAWISLQKGEATNQLKQANLPVHDWMDDCNDLMDTAALIDHLDLVITVDTSMVHLAGAIGRPTWLLNRHKTDWRWLLDRADSPWYSSVRIFRQTTHNDWESVIENAAQELRLKLQS